MTNEEILNNAPKDGTATHYNYKFYLKLNNAKWQFYSFGKWNDMSTPNNRDIRSLSDIRRIVELEKQVRVSNEIMGECWAMVGNDIDYELGGYDTLHEHVNALKERAEAAERERDDALLNAEEQRNMKLLARKQRDRMAKEVMQLRQQLNGDAQ